MALKNYYKDIHFYRMKSMNIYHLQEKLAYLEVNIAKFAFIEFKKFMFFGYGGGGFENLLKINFQTYQHVFAITRPF